MELPTGYRLRAPRPRDAPEVAAVVVAHDIADFGEPDFSEEDLLDDWERPRFDLERDAWVVVGPTGRLVGYAFVWQAEPAALLESDAFVVPEYGGRGLGGQLVDLVEARARVIAAGTDAASLPLGMYASRGELGEARAAHAPRVRPDPHAPAAEGRPRPTGDRARTRVGVRAARVRSRDRRGRGARGDGRGVPRSGTVLAAAGRRVARSAGPPPGLRPAALARRRRRATRVRSSPRSSCTTSAGPAT